MFSYVYDAGGERVLKSNGGGAQVSVNGSPKGGNGSIGNYTVYVNPYVVIRNGGATKHFYIESQRIATKILESKDGLLQNVTTTSTAPAGNRTVDYAKKQNLLENDFNLILAKVDGEAGNSGQTPPNGNAYGWNNGNNGGTNNGNGNNGGNNGGTNNGGGNNGGENGGNTGGGNGNNVEKFVFYYHPDHLGSSSYITDVNGEVSQHIEYFAFGETFVEEHSNTDRTPYLYNAKELDEETGLYYYGARYYNPRVSLWLNVDPLAEKFPGWSPYVYSFNNPVRYTDPDGRSPLDIIYLNANGSINRVVNNGSKYITVVDTDGKGRLLSTYDISRSFTSWNNRNRQIVANISGYYGRQVGVRGIGATYEKSGMAHYDPADKGIWVAPSLENGKVDPQFNNKYNLQNTLVHENFHKINDANDVTETFFTHAKVVYDATKDKYFQNTSSDYKIGQVGYFSGLIMNSYYQEGNKEKAKNLINSFNKLKTGYTLDFDSTNGRMNINMPNNKKGYIPYEKSNSSPNLK